MHTTLPGPLTAPHWPDWAPRHPLFTSGSPAPCASTTTAAAIWARPSTWEQKVAASAVACCSPGRDAIDRPTLEWELIAQDDGDVTWYRARLERQHAALLALAGDEGRP